MEKKCVNPKGSGIWFKTSKCFSVWKVQTSRPEKKKPEAHQLEI